MNRDEREFVREFCTEVHNWRRDLGLRQCGLAQLVERSPSWVSMVEHGSILPDYPMRKRIRLALEGLEFERAARRRKQRSAVELTGEEG